MDIGKKLLFKSQLHNIGSNISSVALQASQLNNAVYPVIGAGVTIHTLPIAASIIQRQSDTIVRFTTLMEELIDEM